MSQQKETPPLLCQWPHEAQIILLPEVRNGTQETYGLRGVGTGRGGLFTLEKIRGGYGVGWVERKALV